jgi:ATP-dependent Clp protease adaptor protein ClpS
MATEPRPGDGEKVQERKKEKTEQPKLWKVLLHNDDYTTMEYVVLVLMEFFHKDETEAVTVMLHVHTKGVGIAGVYTRDVAETKVAEVTAHAEENGMPLLVTAEPE